MSVTSTYCLTNYFSIVKLL